ncbi:portal protein [Rhizorhabdus wittichii]|uniref:portal protein n=1 Tax=Rhizorhabdus wittichii TaxID=160791 RepID=UPI00030E0D7F|nr:portal protein [Rhizorhabdus wittichii]
MDAKALITRGDQLFSKRGSLLSLWQEIADQCYPERADFTVTRTLGEDFAGHLTTSYPIMMRRDLGNSFASMLRSTAVDWFAIRASREEYEDQAAKEWLEWATGTMRRAMYDRRSKFTRATKEGDHDFAAFGQAVMSVDINRHGDGLLFRCWHLRDCAWSENEDGDIDELHRKWKPTAAQIAKLFPFTIHPKVMERLTGAAPTPYAELQVRHIVMPSEDFGDPRWTRRNRIGQLITPFVSIFIDVEHMHIMECVGQRRFKYVVPRWQTVSGSQYAFSPATVAGLPDMRLLQDMSRVLLEAGEKATNPPMVAVQEAIRGDVSIFAGGITWVDQEYDERLGEVLRPLTQDKSGLPIGIDMRKDVMMMLREGFFLNTLTLPQNGPEMTAYEVGQRIQEYIRQASPIFEPMEDEYNGALCETTFDVLMDGGAFGGADEIPESIRGDEVGFRFESPLHEAIERQKGQKFAEVSQLFAQTVQVEPSVQADVDFRTAFRDVITSLGAPAKWLRSEDEADRLIDEQAAEENAAKMLEAMGAGANVAEQIGKANQVLGPEEMAA